MVLKSASYTNHFRISWKDIFRYQIKHKSDIRNHYVIWSAMFNRSHGDIYVYLELCKQKRAKQQEEYLQSRDNELEFSRVPYSDSKQKRASACGDN